MPRVYCGSPTTTAEFTSDTLHCVKPEQYTLAVWSHAGSYTDLTLDGGFNDSFDPAWTITTVTACAGGATGSGRYVAATDYFPFKRVRATLSASTTSASGIEIWLENRE